MHSIEGSKLNQNFPWETVGMTKWWHWQNASCCWWWTEHDVLVCFNDKTLKNCWMKWCLIFQMQFPCMHIFFFHFGNIHGSNQAIDHRAKINQSMNQWNDHTFWTDSTCAARQAKFWSVFKLTRILFLWGTKTAVFDRPRDFGRGKRR